MMKKLGLWIVGIMAIISTVVVLAAFAGERLAGNDRIVIKARRPGFLDPFVIPQDLYAVAIDGTGEVNEKMPRGLGDEAEWSPNGKWIVYSTVNNFWGSAEKSDIYLIRSDGSNRTRLTNHRMGGSFSPAWSTDGTKIAYFSYDNDGNKDGIYIIDVECLVRDEKCSPTPHFLVSGQSPDWSPDGNFIVYTPAFSGDGIFLIRADGERIPRELTPPAVKICHNPQWSPDGTKIATSCYQEQSDTFEIYVIDPNSSLAIALTEGSMPRWSPDGSKIAFVSRRDGLGNCIGGICGSGGIYSNAIYLMNSDGSDMVRLSLRDDESVLWYAWVH
jgi:Tol biopolymer transport system component